MFKYVVVLLLCVSVWSTFAQPSSPDHAPQAADLLVFADSLSSSFEDWSWDTTSSAVATPVHAGSAALSIQYTAGFAGFSLRTSPALDGSEYTGISFWAHGGTAGATINLYVQTTDSGTALPSVVLNLPANSWQEYTYTWAQLGSPAAVARITWQNPTANAQGPFYLDDIVIEGTGVEPLTLSVDVATDRRAMSPYIYGMNFPSEALAAELDLPIARWGGNSTSRYNWQTSVTNTGSDYFYQNVPYTRDPTRTLPAGSASDLFIEQNRRTGTDSIITIPMLDLVARSDSPTEHPYFCGFKVSVYGAQQAVDPWDPDCGNGVRTDGTLITNNDPTETSMTVGTAFIGAWIDHLVTSYGAASAGGVRFYGLDNEPMLWDETHRDVHPTPTSYAEMRDRTYTYAPAIKQHDPSAQTLGPQLFGWTAYFYSALDWAAGGAWYNNPIDRNAHDGLPFSAWYLQEMQRYETENNLRILDYFDLHYYPQATGVTLAPAGDQTTQARRLRTTRSLWDSTYADESWISDGNPTAVELIPRMRAWVNTYYPGTKLAISEYNWGGHEHINGAVAQADVLGIFGREGVDLAMLWGPPTADQPAAFAYRMYLNYDGAGSKFGETSVQAMSSNQHDVAIYAAQRADGAVTLMVLNKTFESQTVPISIANFAASTVVGYSYNADNLQTIQTIPGLSIVNNSITSTLPAQSINLFVLRTTPVVWANQLYLPSLQK